MNLGQLIRLSNQLENLTVSDLQNEALGKFSNIMYETNIPNAGVDEIFRNNLYEQNKVLQTAFINLEQDLADYKAEVKRLIEIEGIKWFQTSSARYEQELQTHTGQQPGAVNLHRNKPIVLSAETDKILKGRIDSYNHWQYPAMVIHPMMELFILNMVGHDPLYLVDESHDLLEYAMNHWNEGYRNRLREYHIEESFDQAILDKLPDGQFGFVLAYNYLNYRPYEIIKKYLEEIYQKLKPGGVVAFTFSDCDRFQAIQNVEQGISCYTPGVLIKGYAEYLGFEEIFIFQEEHSSSVWLELKKPGVLTSLRGGGSLAKILPKPVA